MHKPIKYVEKAVSVAANAAWFLFDRVNSINPNPSFTPKWSDKPLLKSWEKSKPPLGWPRETDSLCPKCVPEIRQQILDGKLPVEILKNEKVGEVKAQIVERDGKILMVKECPKHGKFEDVMSIDPAFMRHLEEVFPGRDIRAHSDEHLHHHGSSTVKHGRGSVLTIDLTNIPALRAGISDARKAHGPINVLVNNAAHDERHRTEEMTPEYWDDRVAVNLKHCFFAAQAVLPDMKAAQAGAIINFSSISWIAGQGGMAAYTASKSGMLGLTRSLARDYGSYNIRVNAVAPGWIMTERQIEKWLTPEGEAELMRRQCLKRKLVPDEIAKFVVFLASDEASACTSQHYVVDGGWV